MVKFVLAIHNHQPVGNFDHVIKQAFDMSYRPFTDALLRHPSVKVSMHFSGILYDWFEKHQPDYLETLRGLAASGQIELVGGGYYEPILAVLPKSDQAGQVAKMQDYLKARFGFFPKGVWLAERVWEPQLAGALSEAGAAYTVLDDIHFFSSGLAEKDLTGYFTTEFEGRTLSVFPINHRLRYLIPFADPERTIDYLRAFQGSEAALVMADDGEKFGLWPGTHDLVYKRGWLDRFFDLLERNSSWLETAVFSQCLAGSRSKGLVYLPTTSYHELTQWALPAESSGRLAGIWKKSSEEVRPYLRGGYFRNFFSKYPESNSLYRRMLRVSARVHAAGGAGKESLWKAQCNCGYWHGVFGGVYLPHIRKAISFNLLEASAAVSAGMGEDRFEETKEDWDADGSPEIFVETKRAAFYFAPAKGGGLWEWDWLPRGVNFSAVVSRHPEAYHDEAGPENITGAGRSGPLKKNLKNQIFYDWHRRMNLLDHFFHPDTKLEAFKKAAYGEQGDFVTGEYSCKTVGGAEGLTVSLARDGFVWAGAKRVGIRVEKDVLLGTDGSWKASYRVSNSGGEEAALWFAPELVFSFSDPSVCPEGERRDVPALKFTDPVWGAVELVFSEPVLFWAFNLDTVARSEEGLEKTYQGSVLAPGVKKVLGPGQSFEFTVKAAPI
jgi:alpha-amylase